MATPAPVHHLPMAAIQSLHLRNLQISLGKKIASLPSQQTRHREQRAPLARRGADHPPSSFFHAQHESTDHAYLPFVRRLLMPFSGAPNHKM